MSSCLSMDPLRVAGKRSALSGPAHPNLLQRATAVQPGFGPTSGAPYENRTRVSALRGQRPGPLDEGSIQLTTGDAAVKSGTRLMHPAAHVKLARTSFSI